MSLDIWTAEGGAAGTNLTTGNSGGASGVAGTVAVNAGTTITYESDQKMHGNLSIKADRQSSNGVVYFQRPISAAARVVAGMYFKFLAFPAGNCGLIRLHNGTANVCSSFVTPTGTIIVQDSQGVTQYTSAALSTGLWYRGELAGFVDTTTTGVIDFGYYLGDGTSPVETPANLTAKNLLTTQASLARFGRFDTTTTTGGLYMDDLFTQDKASGFVGPVNVPPAGGGKGFLAGMSGLDAEQAYYLTKAGLPQGSSVADAKNAYLRTLTGGTGTNEDLEALLYAGSSERAYWATMAGIGSYDSYSLNDLKYLAFQS